MNGDKKLTMSEKGKTHLRQTANLLNHLKLIFDTKMDNKWLCQVLLRR
jgi:hypothetical protein